MLVNIKHTNDTKVTVEVENEDSILKVKEKINEKFPDIPPSQQRLIYSGKILKDEDLVSTYSIKDGNTLHLVKSQKPGGTSVPKPASPQTSTASSIQANAAAATTNAPPIGTVPTRSPNTAAPAIPPGLLNGLGGDMFGNANAMNDPAMQSLLQNPALMQMSMQMLASNPQLQEAIINSNPALRNMTPEMRRLMFSPEIMSMLTNPAMMSQMQSMGGAGAGAGFGGIGGGANPALNPELMNQLLSGLGGGLGGAQMPAATPPSNEPPEVRFRDQLQQLQDMGFYDRTTNIQALQRFNGNVNAAVEYLLSNFPPV